MIDAPPERPLSARDEPGEHALAGLWSSALQSLVARAAHEINNALNGAIVNVEVVRARARPGVDGAGAAPFAEAAAERLESSASLVGALLALARAPRAAPDVATIARDALTLLAAPPPVGARSAPTGTDPLAARLAVVAALVAVAAAGSKAESAGTDSAKEPVHGLRCTIRSDDRPAFELSPRYGAELAPAVERVLARAGIVATYDGETLTLAFPPPASP